MPIKNVKAIKDPHSPNHIDSQSGEEGLGGSTTNPDADDNVLDAAKKAGLYVNSSEENQEPLNIRKQIEEHKE